MSKTLPTLPKWRDSKELDLNKYTSSSSKGCILEADPEYLKELRQLHDEYPLTPYQINQRKDQRNQRKYVA